MNYLVLIVMICKQVNSLFKFQLTHFICGVCKRIFKEVDDLKEHLNEHNIPHPWQCTVCGVPFTNKYVVIANSYRILPISGRVDKASATETVDLGSILSWGQIKDYKNWYSQLTYLTFSNLKDSVKPPPCVVDRWAGGILTRRPKDPFAVFGLGQRTKSFHTNTKSSILIPQ